MSVNARSTHIAVFFNLRPKVLRDRYEGILRYASSRQDWEVRLASELDLENPSWLADGILAQMEIPRANAYRRFCERKLKRHVPLVVFDLPPRRRIAHDVEFLTDDRLIGETAADHFLARGFTNFAYVGSYEATERRHCVERERGYRGTLHEAGFNANTILLVSGEGKRLMTDELADRLKKLPLPCAVFAYSDPVSCMVLDACRQAGLSSPGQVAILGVDNNMALCESRHPTLSSILPMFERSGFEAAEALDLLMRGERTSDVRRSVGVLRTVERESTADAHGRHRIAFAAVRYMRENACGKLRTSDLADALHISRRLLELRFRETFGRSVHDHLLDIRLSEAEKLLKTTAMTLPDIAQACGFSGATGLSAAFRLRHGQSPGVWRHQGD